MKPERKGMIVTLTIVALIVGVAVVSNYIIGVAPQPTQPEYYPHMVMMHICPEESNLAVSAWASDMFPPTSGVTNNQSDIVFEMISSVKYNIWIPNRSISLWVYPIDSYYRINCSIPTMGDEI